jgi:hypothetical protein
MEQRFKIVPKAKTFNFYRIMDTKTNKFVSFNGKTIFRTSSYSVAIEMMQDTERLVNLKENSKHF